jgi:hypothetical protein
VVMDQVIAIKERTTEVHHGECPVRCCKICSACRGWSVSMSMKLLI